MVAVHKALAILSVYVVSSIKIIFKPVTIYFKHDVVQRAIVILNSSV